ncbi:MAG: hypothetical protein Q7V20_11495 [Aquabacterium sp.]|uniref:hypothetical protein n=1 Tax=Aquabacterium sp. TaxID=1872578 RepID=UPI002722D48E|nr:hypothetical protein [Aquabacterium sp.]MDO9004068.1 hypothetical protein [Aquabacterium sp.]
MSHQPVPERYRGVWSRTLLETPTQRDDTSLVLWMQTELWHADLRIPLAARADRIKAPLSAMSSGQHQALALQSGFCGITQVERRSPQEDEICTWHRRLDYQPPGLSPDAGWMVFESDDRVIETGVHGVYREVWERLPESIGPCTFREQADAQNPVQVTRILTAGRCIMQVRPRACAWPTDTRPGDTLTEVVARHPTQASSLLDFEVSFGVLDEGEGLRWTLHHSTLPELESTLG